MPATYQDFIALGLVALAAASLVHRFARAIWPKTKSGCASGCANCSFAKQALRQPAPPLVPVSSLSRPRPSR